MPQLDKISIFTEVFYLFGAFLFLFVYISYKLLPELALLLKIKTAFSQFNDRGLRRTLDTMEIEYVSIVSKTLDNFQAANLNLGKAMEVELPETVKTVIPSILELNLDNK